MINVSYQIMFWYSIHIPYEWQIGLYNLNNGQVQFRNIKGAGLQLQAKDTIYI